jgi:superfamily I DNA and RNA helicase
VYSIVARELGSPPRDFNYAVATFGREDAFKGACAELLAISSSQSVTPIFDAVLIDEAQDLPPEFFQLAYRFTSEPKRVIFAFDELQRLSETAMPATDELFGFSPSGASLVSLDNTPGEAQRDVVLPVCYRNSPWSLATAHALGFGIYREGGLVQGFDDPETWRDIGYSVIHGRLEEGESVELERSRDSYPDYFPRLLEANDAVVLQSFRSEGEEDSWVAEQIAQNLTQDELDHDDILVVLPDAYTSKRRASRFGVELSRRGIDSHLVGVGSSADQVFLRNSIALAHIYRAKGNEASMVYVLDAQYASRAPNVVTRRNTLFTAITRSRGWVRICGYGMGMGEIGAEITAVQAAHYRLNFTIPTGGELASLRRVHRERSNAEVASLKRATRGAQELLDAVELNQIALEDLPPHLRTRLLELVREDIPSAPDE